MKHGIPFLLCVLIVPFIALQATESTPKPTIPIETIPAMVDFGDQLQEWDGFGFNYVEYCQSRDIDKFQQDLGGFSKLDDEKKAEIIEAVFGEDGLDIDILKMFLDPWHQEEPGGPFDHTTTTRHMLHFVENGVKLAKERGKDIEVVTTLYGPPPWATKQKFVGGRDLDHEMITPLADYMIDWALFLRGRGIQAKYLSIHNEGEDFYRWNFDDGTQRLERFDYNMYWRPSEINKFIVALADRIAERGVEGLKVTNGEPSNWTRLRQWGYADALAGDPEAMKRLGLLTTHGFVTGDYNKLSYSSVDSYTTDLLRSINPDLKTWITSFFWSNNTHSLKLSHEHLYVAGANAVILWAGVQHPESWIGGDGHPETGIIVSDDGAYEITNAFYMFKHLTQAGHKGMRVARTHMANPVSYLFAFDGNGTDHPDAFVVTCDIAIWKLPYRIEVRGTNYTKFRAFRTASDGTEQYKDIGVYEVKDGAIIYDAPKNSVTTFIGVE